MKKIFVTLCAVLVMTMLVACSGKLDGTYTNDGISVASLTFSGDSVKLSGVFGITAEGTYEIDGDTITFKYTILGLDSQSSYSFKEDGDRIYIDDLCFTKQ